MIKCCLSAGMLVAGLVGCEANHPSAKPTTAAQQALHKKFRGPLEQLEWQSSPKGLVASFQWKTIPVRSWVTPEGNVLETELEMEDEDVPPTLRDTLQRHYKHYQIRQKHLVEIGSTRFFRLEMIAPEGGMHTYSFRRDGRGIPTSTR